MPSAIEYIQEMLSEDSEMSVEISLEGYDTDPREVYLLLKTLQMYPNCAEVIEKLELTARNPSNELKQLLNNLEFLPNLQELAISGVGLDTLDCSRLSNLRVLNVSDSCILQVNVSGLKQLEEITAFESDLQEINLAGASNLKLINTESPDLQPLDLSGLTQLEEVVLQDGKTTEFACTDLTNLRGLHIYVYVKLAKLNLQHATQLERLAIGNDYNGDDHQTEDEIDYKNPLAILDLSGLQNIKTLKVSHTNVTTLDLTEQALLRSLDIKFSSIHSIYGMPQNVQIVGFGALSQATRIALKHLKPGENNSLTPEILDAHFTDLFQKLLQEVISAEFKEDLLKLFILRKQYTIDMIIKHLINDHGIAQKIDRNVKFLREAFADNSIAAMLLGETDVLEDYLHSLRFMQLQQQALATAKSMITTVCERFQNLLIARQNEAVMQAAATTTSSSSTWLAQSEVKRCKIG